MLEKLADAYGVEVEGVPTTFLGGAVFAGFSEEMQPGIEQAIRRCIKDGCESPLDRLSSPTSTRQPA